MRTNRRFWTLGAGAGFTLATHDLEIRGAGELLGDEQSGQISAVGFSLYMEMLEQAVEALKRGETEARLRQDKKRAKRLLDRLTARERDVLTHVVNGNVSRDIADRLGISARTVEAHRNRIMQKLEVRNVAELVRLVVSATSGVRPEGAASSSDSA